jgi:hypothetical protein
VFFKRYQDLAAKPRSRVTKSIKGLRAGRKTFRPAKMKVPAPLERQPGPIKNALGEKLRNQNLANGGDSHNPKRANLMCMTGASD